LLTAVLAFGALLLSGFLIFVAAENVASAETREQEDLEKALEDEIESGLGNLDIREFQEFVNSLDAKRRILLRDGVSSVIKRTLVGELGGVDEFAGEIKNLFFAVFLSALPAALTVIIICIAESMLTGLTSGFKQQSTSEIIHFVCYAASTLIILSEIVTAISVTAETVGNLKKFSEYLFPPLLTLMSALGGRTMTAAYQPLLAAASAGVIGLISNFVLPVFIATIVFSAIGNLSGNVKLENLTKLTRNVAEWTLMAVFGVFIAFITVQGIVGAAADRITVSAAKFALSSYVPILGGYLSDGFDLVYASCVLIKNALGYTGVLALGSVVIYPIILLAVQMLALRLGAAVTEPLGGERISKFLTSVAKNLRLLITAVAGTGFMFFIVIMLLLCSA
jgi:stage III sporulation protein AE